MLVTEQRGKRYPSARISEDGLLFICVSDRLVHPLCLKVRQHASPPTCALRGFMAVEVRCHCGAPVFWTLGKRARLVQPNPRNLPSPRPTVWFLGKDCGPGSSSAKPRIGKREQDGTDGGRLALVLAVATDRGVGSKGGVLSRTIGQSEKRRQGGWPAHHVLSSTGVSEPWKGWSRVKPTRLVVEPQSRRERDYD